jgi:hypothetical protein
MRRRRWWRRWHDPFARARRDQLSESFNDDRCVLPIRAFPSGSSSRLADRGLPRRSCSEPIQIWNLMTSTLPWLTHDRMRRRLKIRFERMKKHERPFKPPRTVFPLLTFPSALRSLTRWVRILPWDHIRTTASTAPPVRRAWLRSRASYGFANRL